MKLGIRRTVAALGSLLLASGVVVAAGGTAHAAAPWPADPASVADIVFYDASGNVVVGGSINDAPFASYAQATGVVRAGDTLASLFAARPIVGEAPGSWPSVVISETTSYPNGAAPPALKTSALPLVSFKPSTYPLAWLTDDLTPNGPATGSYEGVYQLRLVTSKANDTAGLKYATAAIKVTGTAWTRIDDVRVPTTTALTVAPAGPVYHGSKVTLGASVLPALAGSFQFKDGATVIRTVPASAGTATFSTTALSNATHRLSATFVPSVTGYAASTSATKSLVVRVRTTTTSLSLSKTKIVKGKKVTLTAKVAPTTARGVVKFYDGSKLLKTVTLTSGKAVYSKRFKAVGKHKLKAKFVPANSANFTRSTSATKTLTVKK